MPAYGARTLRTDRVRYLMRQVRQLDSDEIEDLRAALEAYYPGTIDSWEELAACVSYDHIDKFELCELLAGVPRDGERDSSLGATASELGALIRQSDRRS